MFQNRCTQCRCADFRFSCFRTKASDADTAGVNASHVNVFDADVLEQQLFQQVLVPKAQLSKGRITSFEEQTFIGPHFSPAEVSLFQRRLGVREPGCQLRIPHPLEYRLLKTGSSCLFFHSIITSVLSVQ